jgi:hypothetical protein
MDTLEGRCEMTPIGGGLEGLRFDAEGKLPPIFHHER